MVEREKKAVVPNWQVIRRNPKLTLNERGEIIMKDHLKKQLFVSLLLVLALVMCACGGNTSPSESANVGQSASQPATTKKASTAAAPTATTKKAVTPAAFKAALETVGYMEYSEFEAKYADAYAAMEDGVIGCMYYNDDFLDLNLEGVRKSYGYETEEFASGYNGVAGFLVFDSQSYADELYNLFKDMDSSMAMRESIDESYTKFIVNYDGWEGIVIKDGKTIIVIELPSEGLPTQIVEILGY